MKSYPKHTLFDLSQHTFLIDILHSPRLLIPSPLFLSHFLSLLGKERGEGNTSSPAIDVFALGATLYCMVVGRPPWMANSHLDLVSRMNRYEVSFPEDRNQIGPHLKHLLRRLMDKDPDTRITLPEVMVDDWVTQEGSDPLDIEDSSSSSSDDGDDDGVRQ